MTTPRSARRTTGLSREKVLAFRTTCRQRGHIGATLIYSWLWSAQTRAALGHPLPPKGTQPSDERTGMLWSQDEDEYHRWAEDIERAGSTVRDVVGELVDCYLDADGDLVLTRELMQRKARGYPSVAGPSSPASGTSERPEQGTLPIAS